MYCDIQSLPHDMFHHKLEEINLSNNKGKDDDYDYAILVEKAVYHHR